MMIAAIHTRWTLHRRHCATAVLSLLAVLAVMVLPQSAQAQTRSYPHPNHMASFRPFYDGDFLDARREFGSTPRLKMPRAGWVDSIPYHAMMGECLYQMGDLQAALQQFTTALQIYLRNSGWLVQVQAPDTLQPTNRSGRRGPTWGTPSRVIRVARIPDMRFRMGNTDRTNQEVLQKGGVFQPRYFNMLDAKEIVRCTALAIRRRNEILGPANEYDSLTSDLVAQLSRRPAEATWAQAWISVQLGLAYVGQGKIDEAKAELQKSLLAAGMDHNLTPIALLELGKLAFEAQEYSTASRFFLEATYSAAMQGEDDRTQYATVAEAFRWHTICHIATNPGTFSTHLAAAVEWSRRGFRTVEASLLLSAAENSAAIGDVNAAGRYLELAAKAMLRRDCANGELGARYEYITAQVSAQTGDAKRGGTSLAKALAFQRKASRRLFHITLSDQLYTSGSITSRQSGLLYAQVLRDPNPHDWIASPLESLAVLTVPHVPAFENWFRLSIERKENDNALRISEALRRHRFYVSLPLGGRLLNLRWIVAAPDDALPQDVALQRQDLLNRQPALAELLGGVAQMRSELRTLSIDADDTEIQRKIIELQRQIESASEAAERVLQAIALSREASGPVFPPNTDVTMVQQQLKPEQRVVAFIATRDGTYAFMLGAEDYSTWKLEAPTKIRGNVATMLREMGQYDRNQPVGLEELQSVAWKETAAELLSVLTPESTPDAWKEFEELIVVPDRLLWYVPFEALQIQDDDQSFAVIDKVRVRYAPTISLTVPNKQPRLREMRTVVVAGNLFPRDGDSFSQELVDDLKADDPNVFQVAVKPPPATAVLAKSIDRLVVLDDLNVDVKGPYDWVPMTVGRTKAAGSLGQWMRLPWGAPDQVLLPGFHTPAENALKRGGTGEEMFLTVCGIMATGSRTVLLSRWRDGGRTSHDLVREFVRELPHRAASQAWQRSVRLASSADLAWNQEPRIKEVPPDTPPITAQHPFFWGGYMLIDRGVEPVDD